MNKVLFVLGDGTYPHVTGGMEVFNFYIIKELSKTFSVSYLSTNKMNLSKAKHYRSFALRPVRYLFPLQLFFHLLFHKTDKIIFSFSSSHAIIWFFYNKICKILNRKYIVVIHYGDVTPGQNEDIYKCFFNDANAVIAVSEDIKRNYNNKYGIESHVIYPLVPFHQSEFTTQELRLKYNIPINAQTICMVGSLKKMKNPNTILDALHLFSQEELSRYNPYIVFAGNGPDLEKLKKLSYDYKLSEYISFLGIIPKEQVCDIYKMSDFYLISSDFEGTSVSLLEAMFNKKSIIASRVPGVINTIREQSECLMFSVKDPVNLKACLIMYFEDKAFAERLGEQAYKHYLSDYSYKTVVNEYIKYINA